MGVGWTYSISRSPANSFSVDHFSIARYNSGDWSALRSVLVRPSVVVLDQGAIFDDFRVWPLQRLLTHVVLGGLLVGSLVLVAPTLAVLSAVVLYAHVLMSVFPAAMAPNA